jgi:hypothetical protein
VDFSFLLVRVGGGFSSSIDLLANWMILVAQEFEPIGKDYERREKQLAFFASRTLENNSDIHHRLENKLSTLTFSIANDLLKLLEIVVHRCTISDGHR